MNYKHRRIGTIDLGSNSCLLLVAERSEQGTIAILADESATPRISEGTQDSHWISPAAIERAIPAIETFAKRARELKVDELAVTATAAVREASNQEEVVKRLSNAAGVPVEVLDSSEEARLSYLSVTTDQPHQERTMVVDIGGGSTEVTWGIGSRFDGGRSLNLGTVKLLEKHLPNELPSSAELQAARDEINARLDSLTPYGTLDHYYGTAGSFTHLASLELELDPYDSNRVAGHTLTQESISDWVTRLAKMSFQERLKLKGIDPRRVDVLLPGTLIIEQLLARFGNRSFQVFDRGVRYGKLYDLLRGNLRNT